MLIAEDHTLTFIGTGTGVVLGWLGSAAKTMWIDARKQRITDYNKKIDDILLSLDKMQDLIVSYWTSSTFDASTCVHIKLARQKIHSDFLAAHRDQDRLFPLEHIVKTFNLYCSIVTGESFESPSTHSVNMDIPVHGHRFWNGCREAVGAAKCKLNILHLLNRDVR